MCNYYNILRHSNNGTRLFYRIMETLALTCELAFVTVGQLFDVCQSVYLISGSYQSSFERYYMLWIKANFLGHMHE